ncbi:MAG: RDD family protein [Acidothermus sp.]|nr:RDD family protein [Acidothermus sp.]
MSAGLVTGEAVAVDLNVAWWPSRMLAKFIDFAVQYGVALLLGRILAIPIEHTQDVALLSAFAVVYGVAVFIGYQVVCETVWRGRTIGKVALGLRAVREDGSPIRFAQALVRGVLLPFEMWGPALVSAVLTARGKRVGDLLAGTIVVHTRTAEPQSAGIHMPPPLMEWASLADLSRVTDELALVCRQFVLRQHQLRPAVREGLGQQLVRTVYALVSPPPPVGTPGWAYLAAVLAERRRRQMMRAFPAAQPRAEVAPPVTPPPSPPPTSDGAFAPPQ